MAIIGAAGADKKVKASSTDKKASNLLEKLSAGTNVTLTKLNAGGNESIEISATLGGGVTETVIGAGATVNVDTKALTDFCSINYNICAFSTAENQYRSWQLHGSKKTSASVEYSVHSKVGDMSLKVNLDFKIVATDAVLEVVNNELFAVTVRYSRDLI